MSKQLHTEPIGQNGITQSWVKDLLIMALVGLLITSYFLVVNVCSVGEADGHYDEFVSNFVFSAAISMLLYGLFRIMFRLLNSFFPWNKSMSSRIIIQLVAIIAIAVFGMHVFMLLWEQLFSGVSFSYGQYVSNSIIAIIVSLIVNALYEGINLYRQLKDSQVIAEQLRRKNIESHFETLKNQVNPHFLFNSLNTLLVLIDEDVAQARGFVGKLASYYRYILQVNEKDTVELITEIELLNNYIYLLKCRFGDNLQMHINIPSQVTNKQLIPLSLQMLVENAVKHNVISASKPLVIKLYSSESHIIIENNLQKRETLDSSNGIGLENIRSRYNIVFGKDIIIDESSDTFKVSLPLMSHNNA